MAQEQVTLTTIRGLRTAVNEYKNDLAKLDQGTEEYNKTLGKLSVAQGKLNQINIDVRASTSGLTDLYSRLSRATAGVIGGFNAFQGLLKGLGVDTDKFAQSLVKVQTAMSIVQGFQALATGINSANLAFKALNATMAANPIGAVIGLIVAATAALVGLFGIISENIDNTKDLEDAHKSFTESLDDEQEELDKTVRRLRILGATQEEITAEQLSSAKKSEDSIKEQLALIDEQIKRYERLSVVERLFYKNRKKVLEEQHKELIEEQKKYNKQSEQLEEDIKSYREKSDKDEEEKNNKAAERRADQRAAELKRQQDKELSDLQAFNAELEKIREQENARLNEIDKARTVDEGRVAFIQMEIERNKALSDSYLKTANDINETYEERTKAARDYQAAIKVGQSLEDELLRTETEVTAQRIELNRRLYEAQNPENLTLEEQKEKIDAQIADFWRIAESESLSIEERIKALDNYNKALQESGNIEKQIADAKKKLDDDEQSRRDKALAEGKKALDNAVKILGEETAAGKAAAIASATIDTYKAANAANSALSGIPIVGPALGIAAAAAAIGAGVANVREILKTKVPGASDTSSAADIPTMPSFPELTTPIQETHNNLTGYEEALFNEPQRVYVLESDITTTQNKVEVTENQSTL